MVARRLDGKLAKLSTAPNIPLGTAQAKTIFPQSLIDLEFDQYPEAASMYISGDELGSKAGRKKEAPWGSASFSEMSVENPRTCWCK